MLPLLFVSFFRSFAPNANNFCLIKLLISLKINITRRSHRRRVLQSSRHQATFTPPSRSAVETLSCDICATVAFCSRATVAFCSLAAITRRSRYCRVLQTSRHQATFVLPSRSAVESPSRDVRTAVAFCRRVAIKRLSRHRRVLQSSRHQATFAPSSRSAVEPPSRDVRAAVAFCSPAAITRRSRRRWVLRLSRHHATFAPPSRSAVEPLLRCINACVIPRSGRPEHTHYDLGLFKYTSIVWHHNIAWYGITTSRDTESCYIVIWHHDIVYRDITSRHFVHSPALGSIACHHQVSGSTCG